MTNAAAHLRAARDNLLRLRTDYEAADQRREGCGCPPPAAGEDRCAGHGHGRAEGGRGYCVPVAAAELGAAGTVDELAAEPVADGAADLLKGLEVGVVADDVSAATSRQTRSTSSPTCRSSEEATDLLEVWWPG